MASKDRSQDVAPAPASAPSDATTNEDNILQLNKIIKSCRTCMLTTRGEHGLHSRPMATAGVDWDSSKGEFIYFLTPKDSEKVKEVLADPAVALVFSDDSNSQWASVTAHAEVVEDRSKAREMWNPMYDAWFPEGPDTGNMVLIKATPSTASYWKGSYLTRLHIMFSALSAKVTGKSIGQPAGQEQKTVVFHPQPQPAVTGSEASAVAANI
ncbi:hypothetical protein V8C86DRAFT_2752369 [Haematococcus lacustris]